MVRFIESNMGDDLPNHRIKQRIGDTICNGKHRVDCAVSNGDVYHNIRVAGCYANGGCQPAGCNNQPHVDIGQVIVDGGVFIRWIHTGCGFIQSDVECFIESDMGDGFASFWIKQRIGDTSGYRKYVNIFPLSHSDIHHNIWVAGCYSNGGCQSAWCNNQPHTNAGQVIVGPSLLIS